MDKTLSKKGQANLAITVATTAIVLIVLVLVLGQLTTTGFSAVGGIAANTTPGYAAVGNISNYMWTGVTLTALGLVIVAGLGLIGLLVSRR